MSTNKDEEKIRKTLDLEENEIAAINLSKEHIDFVNRNPKVGDEVGKLVLAKNVLQKQLNVVEKLLKTPAFFKEHLEDGTELELAAMLLALSRNKTEFRAVSEEQLKEMEAAGVSMSTSSVEVGLKNKAKNEEVEA